MTRFSKSPNSISPYSPFNEWIVEYDNDNNWLNNYQHSIMTSLGIKPITQTLYDGKTLNYAIFPKMKAVKLE